jgi:hypothetical protein
LFIGVVAAVVIAVAAAVIAAVVTEDIFVSAFRYYYHCSLKS